MRCKTSNYIELNEFFGKIDWEGSVTIRVRYNMLRSYLEVHKEGVIDWIPTEGRRERESDRSEV